MQFFLHKLKRWAATAVLKLADWAVLIGVVMIGGLGSTWYMVEAGTRLTTERIGPWVAWQTAALQDSDPYTRAHFARMGTFPISADAAKTYLAREDSNGGKLHSSCQYLIEGENIHGRWWSISIFDDDGALIPNPAGRYSYTSDTIALAPDGTYIVSLGRDARPGNWLPAGGAGRLALMLTVLVPSTSQNQIASSQDRINPPVIRRVQCR